MNNLQKHILGINMVDCRNKIQNKIKFMQDCMYSKNFT